jgi:hypothetical protein
MSGPDDTRLTSDRNLLLAIIVAFIGQFATAVWWGGSTTQKLADIENRLITVEHNRDADRADSLAKTAQLYAVDTVKTAEIAVLEQKITNMQADINRVETNIASVAGYTSSKHK